MDKEKIINEVLPLVKKALAEDRENVFKAYNESDEEYFEKYPLSADMWHEQLEREVKEGIPSVVGNVVSHYMCGDINLYYKPTKQYREICKEINNIIQSN